MKYNDLKISSHKSRRRAGRGISAGLGKTAGRGTKGQKSRTGSRRKPGFDGGQNPLMQKLPKLRGFTSHRQATETIYTGQLDVLGATIDNQSLATAGLVENAHSKVKLILKGDVSKKHSVSLQSASASAIKALEKAGGKFVVVPRVKRIPKKAQSE